MQVERTQTIAAPPEKVVATLTDVDKLTNLAPQADRIDVLQRGEGRARLAVTVSAGRLGRKRVEGEARLLENGIRFIAVTPTQIDIRWTVRPQGDGSEVTLRMEADIARFLGPLARLIPNQLIDRQVGDEFRKNFAALEQIVAPPPEQPSETEAPPKEAEA